MKKIISQIMIAVFCFVAVSGLEAQNKEKFLYNVTEAEVVNFIKIFPELKKLLENTSNDENTVLMAIQNLPAVKLEAFAKKNGFKDTADLMRVCGGTVSGYAMIKMKEAEEQLNQELSGLAPEMKALLKSQLDAIKIQLKKYESQISQETFSAVKKHYDEMNQLFGDAGGEND